MNDYDRAALARRLYRRAHLTGEYKLRSGTVSNEYFDKYLFEAGPRAAARGRRGAAGTCRLAEGGEVDGRRLAVVEDVVSTGGQIIDSCRSLRDRGAEVVTVCASSTAKGAGWRTWRPRASSCGRCSP